MKSNTYVCPVCKKEVSEFAVNCPNCGVSLDKNKPQKAEYVDIAEKAKGISVPNNFKAGIAVSAIVLVIAVFILSQAVTALNVLRGSVTVNNLLLFKNYVIAGNLQPVSAILLCAAIVLICSLIVLLVFIAKVVGLNQKRKSIQ